MTLVAEIRTFTPLGIEKQRISDFQWLACTKKVNGAGLLQFGLKGNHKAIADLTHKSQVELWVKDDHNKIDWYPYFGGLFLSQDWKMVDGLPMVTLSVPGYMWLLKTRIVNWPANTLNRTIFTNRAAETIMKLLIRFNVWTDATIANGRKRDGAITGVSYAADTVAGNVVDWSCFGDNLLETLQKLAKIAGGDFDLIKTGTNTFEFKWYTGQRGTDRTNNVIFAVERGNMGSPTYTYNRIDEQTAACVWGRGEKTVRDYVTRTGVNYSASNDVEMFVNASDLEMGATAALNARGDEKLQGSRSKEEFEFDVLQTPKCQYAIDYFVGDLVTIVNPFTGISTIQKIYSSTLGMEKEGKINLSMEVGTP
jgi:hypothetical protein